jgi:hypothetical protein
MYTGDFAPSASYHLNILSLTIRQYAILYSISRKILVNLREVVVSRRDIGVKSLSETKTSLNIIEDSKEKQTGEGLWKVYEAEHSVYVTRSGVLGE